MSNASDAIQSYTERKARERLDAAIKSAREALEVVGTQHKIPAMGALGLNTFEVVLRCCSSNDQNLRSEVLKVMSNAVLDELLASLPKQELELEGESEAPAADPAPATAKKAKK